MSIYIAHCPKCLSTFLQFIFLITEFSNIRKFKWEEYYTAKINYTVDANVSSVQIHGKKYNTSSMFLVILCIHNVGFAVKEENLGYFQTLSCIVETD